MLRVVLDTNLLVAAAYNTASASARIVAACRAGRLVSVVSPPLRAEYEFILPRSIRVPGWRAGFEDLMARAVVTEPESIPRVVEGDPADDMLFATARDGRAFAILTNDRLLLPLDDLQG